MHLLFNLILKNNSWVLIGIVFLTVVQIPCCREGIINPGNPVGNLNEPVISRSENNYSFQIDADKVSFLKTDSTLLHITETDVFITVTGYGGGTVQIRVIGESKLTLYQALIANNIDGKQATIINNIPASVSYHFQNFSGKFKIGLSRKLFTL